MSEAVKQLPAQPRKRVFRFVRAADLKVRPIDWLIGDYIEADTLAVLYGPPGAGKSFIALDMACCIATGASFHGHAAKRGAVFYIAGEGHNGIARRLRGWEHGSGRTLNDAPLFVSESATDLASQNAAEVVANEVKRLLENTGQKPALIVVDTLARNFGGNENDATDVGQFIRHVDDLRRHWGATVMIVHHSGKDGDRGARGSSALKGAADAEYEVSRTEDRLIRLAARKMKDADEPATLAFTLASVEVADDAGRTVGSASLQLVGLAPTVPPVRDRLGQQQQKALGILKELQDEHATRLQVEGRDASTARVLLTDWKKRCVAQRISRQRFSDIKGTLLERGLIVHDGVYVLAPQKIADCTQPKPDENRTKSLSGLSGHPIGKPDKPDAFSGEKTGQNRTKPDENRTADEWEGHG